MDVAQRVLVGADQEEADAVAFARFRCVQAHGAVEVAVVHVLVDAAVGVAGEVGDHAAPGRCFVEARDRRDREHLVDGPDVGHRFEHAEVDEVLVDQPLVEFVQHRAMAALLTGQARAHAVGDGVEQVIDTRALAKVDLAQRIGGLAFGLEVLGLVEQLQRRTRIQLVMDVAEMPDRGGLVVGDGRHRTFRRALHLGNVGDQHGMVCGHGAAAFGDDARRRDAVGFAGFGQRLHDVGGVLVETVVDRAEAA